MNAKLRGLILAAVLLPGMVVLSGTTAQAQRGSHGGFHGGFHSRTTGFGRGYGFGGHRRGWYGPGWGAPYYRNGYSQYVFSSSAAAQTQGYHDGQKTGSSDAKKKKSYNPERSHYYQEAGFGNFAEDYRSGFLSGYSNGFGSRPTG